ncbi:MAG TPA: hypothetical protein VFD87_18830 [Phototrophicaceae bacterium]|nr:hypothetical protein [Phototrophicaceae bacterium]
MARSHGQAFTASSVLFWAVAIHPTVGKNRRFAAAVRPEMAGLIATGGTKLPQSLRPAPGLDRKELPGRGPLNQMRILAPDYSAERRHRGGSRVTGLQCCACYSITAAMVAKAP